jgi:hypothetical protein
MPTISNNNSALLENVTSDNHKSHYLKSTKNHNHLPLDQVTSPTVSTDAAAHYLNRKPQTLRAWACLENGPIRPMHINGRLAWPVAGIKTLTGVA